MPQGVRVQVPPRPQCYNPFMSEKGMEIKGSGPHYWRATDLQTYREDVNTLGQNPKYFARFNKPMADRAKRKFGTPIHLLDIACGPADELKFLENDPDIRLIATDISTDVLLRMTRQNLRQNAVVFDMDVSKPPVMPDNSVECGILMNAVIYSPEKMLKVMFDALRPGGECTVNFTIPKRSLHWGIIENSLEDDGIKSLDRELKVEGRSAPFAVKVLDFSESLDSKGKPDEVARAAGQQLFFRSLKDVEELIRLAGFEMMEHSTFDSVSKDITRRTDVFVLKKPETF